jgi:hypothetical protein
VCLARRIERNNEARARACGGGGGSLAHTLGEPLWHREVGRSRRDVRPAPIVSPVTRPRGASALSECRRFGRTRCRCSATPRVTERWAVLVSPSRIVMGIGITRSRSRFLLFRTNGRPIPCREFIRGGPSHAPSACLRQSHTARTVGSGPKGSAGGRKAGWHWPGRPGWHWPGQGSAGGRKAGGTLDGMAPGRTARVVRRARAVPRARCTSSYDSIATW